MALLSLVGVFLSHSEPPPATWPIDDEAVTQISRTASSIRVESQREYDGPNLVPADDKATNEDEGRSIAGPTGGVRSHSSGSWRQEHKTAIDLASEGQWLAAQGSLLSAIGSHGDCPELLIHLAMIELRLRRPAMAVAAYRRALTADPQSDAINDLAWLLATHHSPKIREPKESLRLAEASVERDPENSHRLDTLAAALAANDRFEEAAAALERAIALTDAHSTTSQAVLAQINELKARKTLVEARRPIVRTAADFAECKAIADQIRTEGSVELFLAGPQAFAPLDDLNFVAWHLATHTDPRLRDEYVAVQLAETICDIDGWKHPPFLDTLAAALGLCERWDNALAVLRIAEELTNTPKYAAYAATIARHVRAIESHTPIRDESSPSFECGELLPVSERGRRLAQAFLALAQYRRDEQQEASVQAATRMALVFDSCSCAAQVEHGREMLKAGSFAEAEWLFLSAAIERPDDSGLQRELGALAMREGRIVEACERYEAALKLRPDWTEVMNDLAWLLATHDADRRVQDRAVALAEEACRATDRRSARCLDTLAAALASRGDYAAAIATIQEALAIDESHVDREELRLHLELYSRDLPWRGRGRAAIALADSELRSGNLRAAEERLAQHMAGGGAEIEAFVQLAHIRVKEKKFREALNEFSKAALARPDWWQIQNDMAWLLATEGEVKKPAFAVTLARRICEQTEYQEPKPLDTLAVALAATGELDEAIRTLETALELPNLADDQRTTMTRRLEELRGRVGAETGKQERRP